MASFWTTQHETMLWALIAEGLSASAIAVRLGTTRNAVLTKKHRVLGTQFPYRAVQAEKRAALLARTVERESEILAAIADAVAIGTPEARDAAVIVAAAAGVNRRRIAAAVGLTLQRVGQIVSRRR